MVSPAVDMPTSDSSSEFLVLVSDSSTEAERLIASLRVRGFKVRDVPLALLSGRVEAQQPRLVICDGQVPRVVESLTKMRQGAWGASAELLLLGIDQKVIESLRPLIDDIESRAFARPIDVYSVLQRVEEIIGHNDQSLRPGTRSMAALPRVGSASLSGPSRMPTPPPRRGRSSVPSVVERPDGRPPPAHGEAPEPSSPKLGSIAPPSEPHSVDAAMLGVSVARMSEELEQLLHDADERLAAGPMSLQPVSLHGSRLTPEQELDAILPPDVLAALDEAVDLDEDDETSHPATRHRDRSSSSIAPRGTTSSTNDSLSEGRDDPSENLAIGTSPTDDDTPMGRPAARGRTATTTNAGEAIVPRVASVLTPVPASVKTHHTHHTMANSSPQATSGVDEPAASEREPSSFTHYDVERRRRLEGESIAPGTNPEIEQIDPPANTPAASEREISSTAPPHPPRTGSDNSPQPWGSPVDEVAVSSRRGYVVHDSAPPTVAMRSDLGHAPATQPPAVARAREIAPRTTEGTSSPQRNPPVPSRETRVAVPEAENSRENRIDVEIPAALGPGDVVRALSRCVRSRYSGALAIEDDSGIRRVVLREGDFVMVASGIDGESLIAFLIQRGDLNAEAARLARKLPQFGRHAGAALIAHGYLRQDELWPVLRAHAEWLLGRTLSVSHGSAGLETDLPARLAAEPAVFGGATGAEILVEVVRRIVPPEVARGALGGPRVRLARGALWRLLSECALAPAEAQLVERANGLTLDEFLTDAQSGDFAAAAYALVELGVLEAMSPSPQTGREPQPPPERDRLDDAAIRCRIAIRRGLVDEGDYFALLGISRDATGYEVRHAYLDLRREFEPGRLLSASTADLRPDVDLILEVVDEAYEILRDAARRERYRRALDAAPTASG